MVPGGSVGSNHAEVMSSFTVDLADRLLFESQFGISFNEALLDSDESDLDEEVRMMTSTVMTRLETCLMMVYFILKHYS